MGNDPHELVPGPSGPVGMAALVPPGVRVAERFGPLTAADEAGLYDAEAAAVRRAVPKRRREFATVRRLARAALADLGQEPCPILVGDRGAPQWPAGVVGSMTHCDGYCAAVVTPEGPVRSIGIDAEPEAALPTGVLDTVAGPDERDHLARLRTQVPGVGWDRLLFCAKEATYKVWFPARGTWLGFDEADVRLDPAGTFTVRLLTGTLPGLGADARLRGRWGRGGGVLLACAWI